jgi:hypothetical protein
MKQRAARGSPGLPRRLVLSVCLLATLLAGCSSLEPLALQVAGTSSPWSPLRGEHSTPALDPQLQYLRVTQGQHVAWLVLGGIQNSPRPGLEAWYGADGGVLRLQHGRLVAYASAAAQWSETLHSADSLAAPGWHATGASSYEFQRWTDRMPGWQVHQSQQRRLVAMGTQSPQEHRYVGSLQGLLWWQESSTEPGADDQAWYAIDPRVQPARVVYGQQCLQGSQPRVCLSWQRWPAAMGP